MTERERDPRATTMSNHHPTFSLVFTHLPSEPLQCRWHPFQLNPSAPKEGINKKDYYMNKLGSQTERIEARMSEVFRGHGLEYNLLGLTGNTLDSHRLMHFVGQQGLDKQHNLMEVFSLGYFTQAKFIGDKLLD